jgi:zinc protease
MHIHRNLLFAFLGVLFLVSPPVLAGQVVVGKNPNLNQVFPYPSHDARLKNGMRVVVVPVAAQGMFAWHMVIGVGSRDEVEKGHSGFAHFFEHMMFRGTPTVSAEARTRLLSGLGVDESGYTTDDFTGYTIVGPVKALSQVVDLEGDRLKNLAYSEDTFRTEAKAVLGEYNKNAANPDQKAHEKLRALAFTRHTYQHTTMGFLEDIKKMPERYAYSKKFFKRFYTPDNVLLIVSGDVTSETLLPQLEKAFGSWTGKRAKTATAAEPPQRKERRAHVPWHSPTLARGHVGWRVPSALKDEKSAALAKLLEGYLFSTSSPLHKSLVLQDKKVERLRCWWWEHRDPALFPVVWSLREGATQEEVLDRVQRALDDIAAGRVDPKRFAAVQQNLKYGLLMNLASPEQVGSALAFGGGFALDPDALNRIYRQVGQSTAKELSAFVKAHFGRHQRAVVTLAFEDPGGKKSADGNGGSAQ